MTITTYDPASVTAALDRLRGAEAGMTAGNWDAAGIVVTAAPALIAVASAVTAEREARAEFEEDIPGAFVELLRATDRTDAALAALAAAVPGADTVTEEVTG